MIEIILGGMAVGGALSGTAIGTAIGRRFAPERVVTKEVESRYIKCPYCHNDIVGFDELDRINHVMCINRSADDIVIMNEKKKAEEAAEESYESQLNKAEEARLTKLKAEIKAERAQSDARHAERIAEIRAENKKTKPKARWLTHTDVVWSSSPSDTKLWQIDGATRTWFRYEWKVYKNGEPVERGFNRTEAGAQNSAEKSLMVHKHKAGEDA